MFLRIVAIKLIHHIEKCAGTPKCYTTTTKIPSDDKKRCDRGYINDLDYTNINFSVTEKDYRKIEIMNNININVFGYEKQEPYLVYISKEKFNDMLNLLLLQREKSNTMYSSKASISLCTKKKRQRKKERKKEGKKEKRKKEKKRKKKKRKKKENISACTVCSVSVIKKPSLIIKENCITINSVQSIKMPEADDKVHLKTTMND